MAGPLWKSVGCFLSKLNIEMPYGLAIPLLDTYPEELKAGVQTELWTGMFTAAPVTTARR